MGVCLIHFDSKNKLFLWQYFVRKQKCNHGTCAHTIQSNSPLEYSVVSSQSNSRILGSIVPSVSVAEEVHLAPLYPRHQHCTEVVVHTPEKGTVGGIERGTVGHRHSSFHLREGEVHNSFRLGEGDVVHRLLDHSFEGIQIGMPLVVGDNKQVLDFGQFSFGTRREAYM